MSGTSWTKSSSRTRFIVYVREVVHIENLVLGVLILLGPTFSVLAVVVLEYFDLETRVLVFNDVTLEVLNLDDLVLIVEDIVLDVRFVSMV